jgi:hypothetical protein
VALLIKSHDFSTYFGFTSKSQDFSNYFGFTSILFQNKVLLFKVEL